MGFEQLIQNSWMTAIWIVEKRFSIVLIINITNIEVKLIEGNLMMIYKLNLMNSKPSLMNLASNYRSHISSFESNFKNIIDKFIFSDGIKIWIIVESNHAES